MIDPSLPAASTRSAAPAGAALLVALLVALLLGTLVGALGCPDPPGAASVDDAGSGQRSGPLAATHDEKRLAVKIALIGELLEELERARGDLAADARRAEVLNRRFEALRDKVGPERTEQVVAAIRTAREADPPSPAGPAGGPMSTLERLTRLEKTAADLLVRETPSPEDSPAVRELKATLAAQQDLLGPVASASRLGRQALEHVEELARVVDALEAERTPPP